ncbi:tRNA-dihydrouridine(47) synthase [NAD(P)(+)]-like [Anolis sagrei]|uniref:tRNA-dihydrouridine(47) synthase [NAD(P)(+)]-like n=1 Tax=Anolis sagrei TaxID=38937 RepID=UPI003520061D
MEASSEAPKASQRSSPEADVPESLEPGPPPAQPLKFSSAQPETSQRYRQSGDVCFTGEKCFFGSECPWQHNLEKYLATKPPDIGDCCILFSLFGKCRFGIACRFSGAHSGQDCQNPVSKELCVVKPDVKNQHMDKATAALMAFPFCKSMDYLKSFPKVETAMRIPELDFTSDSLPEIPPVMPRKTVGVLTDEDLIRLRPCEKKKLDVLEKLYLSPLGKWGSVPFRRICKRFGADITCSSLPQNVYRWNLENFGEFFHRHESEDLFGIQLGGSAPYHMIKCAEFFNERIEVDFLEIDAGDYTFFHTGGGCALMLKPTKFEKIVRGMDYVSNVPITVKLRSGISAQKNLAHTLIPKLHHWGAAMVTLHGRPKVIPMSEPADWNYISHCAQIARPMPLFGNGDIFSFEDAIKAKETGVSGVTIARAALVKPWIFTEIKEMRHWDISARERLDMLKDFTAYGLEYWGTDTNGVEKTRAALLQWLYYLCSYIPVGLQEHFPSQSGDEHPLFLSGDYLEVLLSSQKVTDMVKISEMFLGPVSPGFTFPLEHDENGYVL